MNIQRIWWNSLCSRDQYWMPMIFGPSSSTAFKTGMIPSWRSLHGQWWMKYWFTGFNKHCILVSVHFTGCSNIFELGLYRECPCCVKLRSHYIITAVLAGAHPSSSWPSDPVKTAVHFSYMSLSAAVVISGSQSNGWDSTDWLTFHLYMLMKPAQVRVCGGWQLWLSEAWGQLAVSLIVKVLLSGESRAKCREVCVLAFSTFHCTSAHTANILCRSGHLSSV